MARRKISEYRAKHIVNTVLGLSYTGWSVLDACAPAHLVGKKFVVKVDQAVKQRFKRGLIYLDVDKEYVGAKIKSLNKKGYDSILVEPYYAHASGGERYISVRRERDGVKLSYSEHGGVDIEEHSGSTITVDFESATMSELAAATGFSQENLVALGKVFDEQYMSLLEINPYIVGERGITILDVAIEVDGAAELLVSEWSEKDVRSPKSQLSAEEIAIKKLDAESPASFNLDLINPDGSIFLLLSGGGASVVIADELYALGYGDKLANYGEYSGNPNTHETEKYTAEVLALVLNSRAPQKHVFIGGAVANFTDIRSTFGGVVRALRACQNELALQGVKFYVRRGGPRQAEGLALISRELQDMGVYGGVYDPSVSIPTAVKSVVRGIK